jgi:hypothetical protein
MTTQMQRDGILKLRRGAAAEVQVGHSIRQQLNPGLTNLSLSEFSTIFVHDMLEALVLERSGGF